MSCTRPCPISYAFVLLPLLTLGCNAQRKTASTPQAGSAARTSGSSSRSPAVDAFQPAVDHQVDDPVYGVPFANVKTPQGWSFQGAVLHANNCAVMGPTPMYSMQSADQRYGVVILPALKWGWASDPKLNAQAAQGGCPDSQSMSSADFIRAVIIPQLGIPGLQVTGQSQPPELQQAEQQVSAMVQQLNQSASQAGPIQTLPDRHVDGAEVKVAFTANGHPMTGTVAAVTFCTVQRMNMPPSGPVEIHDCNAAIAGFVFAPAEDFDRFARLTVLQVQQNPAWSQRDQQAKQQETQQLIANSNKMLQDQHNQIMANQNAQFQRGQQAHQQQMAQYDQYNKGMQAQSNAYHESNQAFAAHLGDYNDYTDPNTGQTVRRSNQYSNTYSNSQGQTLQTNSPNSPGAQWSQMIPRFK
jgi:hypothetical protein